MSRSTAFQLICKCLSWPGSASDDGALLDRGDQDDFPWKSFVEIATEQMMAATMSSALRRKGLHERVPDPVIKYFDAMHELNARRNARIETEIEELASILNRIGVVPVLLKGGSGLISGLYAEPGTRIMSDIDVLIPAQQAGDSFEQLRSAGFRAASGGPPPNPRHHHLPQLRRPGNAAAIELHRDVLDYPNGSLLAAEEMLDEVTVLEHGNAKLAIPSHSHQLAVNIGHTQFADRCWLYGRTQLRSLHDFGLLVEKHGGNADWQGLRNRFSGSFRRAAYDFHLLAANKLLAVAVPGSPPPGLLARPLFARAQRMIDKPERLDLTERTLRPLVKLRRELSSSELRARLARNMGDPKWWRRHLGMLRRRAP